MKKITVTSPDTAVMLTADETQIALRFDLGAARTLKAIAKIDVLQDDANSPVNDHDAVAYFFLAAHKRDCAVRKVTQSLPDDVVLEAFYELNMTEAVQIAEMFNAALSVPIPPSKNTNSKQELTESADPADVKNG